MKLLGAVALLGSLSVVSCDDINRLLCGDDVSIRSADTWRYLNIPKSGEALVSSSSVGVAEALTIECRDKPAKSLVETGDTVALRVFRGKKYLRCKGTAGQSLFAHADKSWFYIEDPTNLQSRIHVMSGTMSVAFRPVEGADNAFLTVSDGDKLLPTRIRARDEGSQFRLTKVASDFTARCPANARGKMCSGQGVCESNYCVCNREYTGEYCEKKREVATCKAVGDPHWMSFDGAPYNMYETGEFLFYAEPDSPNYEAVTAFLKPWNKASVIAGVTVRRDDDYITIWGHGRNAITINCGKGADGQVADRSREIGNLGNRGMTLESGLNIKLDKGWWVVSSPSFLNVRFRGFSLYIRTEEPRIGSARGLCGNNNKRRDDDMRPRRRYNEPVLEVTDKFRIEDGKTYDYGTSRNGKKNGRPSTAFYSCKADNTFFNFIDVPGYTKPGDDDDEIKPDITFTEEGTTANQGAGALLFGPTPELEEAFASEKCDGDKKQVDAARRCCAQVLVNAKLITNDGKRVPDTTDALRALVTEEALKAAWAPRNHPSAEDVSFDTITCVQDYCQSGSCELGKEHAEDVVSDERAATEAENERKVMAEINKKQVAAED